MRAEIRAFVAAAARAFEPAGPILEVGAYRVAGQDDLAELRGLFPGRVYRGLDQRAGPGVDVVGDAGALPFPDAAFDTVICTHVIEHVLEYRLAIAELRRICRRRLIIVVPREREYRYSFNPHFNFFPYPHSFLRAMHPVPQSHVCEDIGRDIYYREDRPGA